MNRNTIAYCTLTLILLFTGRVMAQEGFGINTPNKAAVIELNSKSKGLLIPRVQLTDLTTFAPVKGLTVSEQHTANSLMVYNTGGSANIEPGYYYWSKPDAATSGKWVQFVSSENVSAFEPWRIQNTINAATANNQNIYQQGKVAVGFTTTDAVSGKQFEVKGDFKTEADVAGRVVGFETNYQGTGISMLYNADDITSPTDAGMMQLHNNSVHLIAQSPTSIGTTQITPELVEYRAGNWGLTDGVSLHHMDKNQIFLSSGAGEDNVNLTNLYVRKAQGITFSHTDENADLVGTYTFPRGAGSVGQVLSVETNTVNNSTLAWKDVNNLIPGKTLTGNGITISPDGTGAVLKDVQLEIADNAITSAKLADNAVTTTKINDKAVTPAKITNGAANQVLVTNAAGDAVTWVNQNTLTTATTNELASTGNSLTSKVNGVVATTPTVNNVTTSLTGNTLTTSVNGVLATADLSGLTNTTRLANGSNTTVSGNGSAATPYTVNVATANGTAAGIVKQAATNATVTVNAQGELAINPSTVATALGKNLTVSEGIEINSGSGTGALLTAAGLRIADNGVTTAKIADKAVTNEKINPGTADKQVLVTSGTGATATTQWVDQSTLTDNTTANNGLTKTANTIQLGGNLLQATTITNNGQSLTIATGGTATAITGLPNTSAADYNGTNGVTTDRMVSMGGNGVLKQLKAAMPKFFYAPSIALPTAPDQSSTSSADDIYYTASNQTYTVKLYTIYSKQFGGTVTTGTSNTGKVANTTRTTALPMLGSSDLDYYITFFDTTVFSDVTVSDTGVMTYKIKSTADVTIGSFMNIVFAVKP